MLYAPFVAGVQIIVYAGGIMVLFLFVIMLVNIERATKESSSTSIWIGRVWRRRWRWARFLFPHLRKRTRICSAIADAAARASNTQKIAHALR